MIMRIDEWKLVCDFCGREAVVKQGNEFPDKWLEMPLQRHKLEIQVCSRKCLEAFVPAEQHRLDYEELRDLLNYYDEKYPKEESKND